MNEALLALGLLAGALASGAALWRRHRRGRAVAALLHRLARARWGESTPHEPLADPALAPLGEALHALLTHCEDERKRMTEVQQAQYAIQERLQLATDASGIGVWDVDLQTRQLSWDPQMDQLYDTQQHPFDGSFEAWKARLHPDDREAAATALEAALSGQAPNFNAEFRVLLKGRPARWLRALSRVQFDAQGRPLRLVGITQDISSAKAAEAELVQKEGYQRALLDNFPFAVWLKDTQSRYLAVNLTFCQMHGALQPEDFIGHHDGEMLDAAQARQFRDEDLEVMRSGIPFARTRQTRLGEQERLFEMSKARVRDAHGQLLGVVGYARDVTEEHQARISLQLAASVFDNSQEAILITDAQYRILSVNRAFTQITGFAADEVLGHTTRLLDVHREDHYQYAQAIVEALAHQDHWSGDIWAQHKDGHPHPLKVSVSQVRSPQGEVQHLVAVMSDISHLKAHEEELLRIAHYDPLTALPNRRLLADRLKQALAHTDRQHGAMAVVVLDLDGFKPINDSLGHEAGDQLLREVAARLQRHLRGGDTAARLGGDEFVLVLLNMDTDDPLHQCEQALARLLHTLAQPIHLAQAVVTVSASVGATVYPQDLADPDTLLRHADQAMYVAKQRGKNRYHLYDAAHDRQVQAHREALARLDLALTRGEFVLFYQPKVDLQAGTLLGVEALIRWQHPERGLLAPGEFLHLLDHTELEIQVGQWVMDAALHQMAAWAHAGLQVPVSINLSARQLMAPGFSLWLAELLQRHAGIDPRDIELELLESAALDDREATLTVLQACRALGVRFALDDFGTGYSSLVHLRRMPVETLKIDQTFVRDMLHDPEDLAIVESVVRLCSTFHRQVVAEGVETDRHAAALLALGCHHGQGYGIARPMAAQALPDWWDAWQGTGFWRQMGQDDPAI